MTRILSAFKILKRVGFAVLSLGVAYAQSPAPIEWGETRLLRNPPEIDGMVKICAQGDTILLIAEHNAESGDYFPMATITGNNGETWSPWHIFENEAGDSYSTAAFTSNSIIVATYVDDFRGFYRTLNLGEMWLSPTTTQLSLRILDTKNDTVFCSIQPAATIWTGNQGATFSPPRAIDLGTDNVRDLSTSDTMLHMMSIMHLDPGEPLNAAYTRAPLLEGDYEPLRNINPDVYCTYNADIEFSNDGVGVMASVVMFEPPYPDYGRLFINVTRDDGGEWTPPDTINEVDSAEPFDIVLKHHSRLWAVAYYDSVIASGFEHSGIYVIFSANHAQSWYPPQQIEGANLWLGPISDMDLRDDRIRIYGLYGQWDGVWGNYSVQWEGLISADSIAPELSNVEQQPLTVPMDTILHFSASGADNDSLWLMQVILKEEGSADSVVLDLERIGVDEFESTWLVPHDSATWHYYFRAEDMWENVTRVPETDDWSFVAEGTSGADERFEIAKEFDLSTYPNPFNSSITIEFALTREQVVTLEIFDVLGRKVEMLLNERKGLGVHQVLWQADSRASGLYFARLSSELQSNTQTSKFLLMK